MKATNTLTGEHVRNRPTWADEAVREAAGDKMVALLLEQHADLKASHDDDAHGFRRDIRRAVDYSSDGFQRAHELAGHGWELDASIVETLNEDVAHDALTDAVRAWVTEEGITASLKVGDRVTVHLRDFEASTSKVGASVKTGKGVEGDYVGEIRTVYEKDATYCVRFDALGHVREGVGYQGLILPFELVEAQS